MQQKAYRNIILLLGLSLLAVVLLQGFWLYYLYRQEQAEVSRLAHRAMNQVANQLYEQENLLLIKHRIASDTLSLQQDITDTVIVTHSVGKSASKKSQNKKQLAFTQYRVISKQPEGKSLTFAWSHSGQHAYESELRNSKEAFLDKKYSKLDSLDALLDTQYANIDSMDAVFDEMNITLEQAEKASEKSAVVLHRLNQTLQLRVPQMDTALLKRKEQELQNLIKKLETEIKMVEYESSNRYNAHMVKRLLHKELAALGLKDSIECAIQKRNKDSVFIASRTPGFLPEKTTYESNLSQGRLFQQGVFLQMHFSGPQNLILSRITRMLVLSLLFTLLMVGVFYASFHLLLKQKKWSEIRNDFVNNMTHELKTPIATIALATDALAQSHGKEKEEKFKEYIRILKEENEKLNTHVEHVLQMALIEKGELKLHMSKIDLKELSQECISSHQLQMQMRQASIHFNCPDSVWIMGDRLHLRNAFSNLIDNALKYSTQSPVIQITLIADSGKIQWQVQDNGPGIATGQLEKIFDKFYRVQKGDLHEVKGFGLGLSYVKSIVEAHGGTVQAKSELGKGSTFTIQFETSHENFVG